MSSIQSPDYNENTALVIHNENPIYYQSHLGQGHKLLTDTWDQMNAPDTRQYLSTATTSLSKKVGSAWQAGWQWMEKIPFVGDYFGGIHNYGKKPLALAGLWSVALGANIFDPNGPSKPIATAMASQLTQVTLDKIPLIWKALIAGGATGIGFGLEHALTHVPLLNRVSYSGIGFTLGVLLFKRVVYRFMKPKVTEDDLENALRTTQTKVITPQSNSISQIGHDMKQFFLETDPVTNKPPLYQRLALLSAIVGGMVLATKYYPTGLVPYALVQFSVSAINPFIRDWPAMIKYPMLAGLAGGSYIPVISQWHPKINNISISLGAIITKDGLQRWMYPNDPANSDNESIELPQLSSESENDPNREKTWYERAKEGVSSLSSTVSSWYQRLSGKVSDITECITDHMPAFIRDPFTKPDGDKPPIGQRALLTGSCIATALAASVFFRGDTVAAVTASIASGTTVTFFATFSVLPRYAMLASLIALGYGAQYGVRNIPYINRIQSGSLFTVNLLGVLQRDMKVNVFKK